MECHKIDVPISYYKGIPAPALGNSSDKSMIFVAVTITRVLAIEEVKKSVSFQFKLRLRWKDPRLAFRNLKKNRKLNTVNMSEAQKVWSPVVVFYNTDDKEESKVRFHLPVAK
jgi:hypothetical protein